MTQATSSWRADRLTWGKGPRVFEVFLEPTYPFSAKAFAKLDETLATAGPDKVTIMLRGPNLAPIWIARSSGIRGMSARMASRSHRPS